MTCPVMSADSGEPNHVTTGATQPGSKRDVTSTEDAGVVHEHVERPERLDSLRHEAAGAVPRADVVAAGHGPTSSGHDLVDHVLRRSRIATGSYAGCFALCFTADHQLVPDPSFYAECLRDSLDELVAAARPA